MGGCSVIGGVWCWGRWEGGKCRCRSGMRGSACTICIALDTLQRRGEEEGEGEGCGSEYGAPSYNVHVHTIGVKGRWREEEGGHRARNGESKRGRERDR